MRKQLARLFVAASIITACLAIAPGFTGCAVNPTQHTAPDQNVVINAEKTLRISKDTFDVFLHLEKNHEAQIKANLPQVHQFAEYLRKNAPGWLITANTLKNDYKHGNAGLSALLSALKVLNDATSTAQQYISQINNP